MVHACTKINVLNLDNKLTTLGIISSTHTGILLHWNRSIRYNNNYCGHDYYIQFLLTFDYAGFPKEEAAYVALKTVREWLEVNAEKVKLSK